MFKYFLRFLLTLAAVSLLSCSPAVPKLKPQPVITNEKVDTDNDILVFSPKIDILFVIDNSGSMQTHQSNLSKNIGLFTNSFSKGVEIDYHIGVVSTDMTKPDESGNLQGTPLFVERSTPDGLFKLSNSIMLGTNGSYEEKSFDPIYVGLGALANTTNAGFLRRDAYLAIVFITDAEDQSSMMGPKSLFDFLMNLKGGKDRVLGYGVIVPTGSMIQCQRDESTTPKRIESFLGMVQNKGKNIMNLCDPDYGNKLGAMGKDMVKYVSGIIYLNRPPIPETIRITYGTQEIPMDAKTGWVFDAEKNAIIVSENVDWSPQPDGTKVQVSYEAARFKH